MATVSRLQFQLETTSKAPSPSPSVSVSSSPSEVSPSFRLIVAARAGMFVKLHVNDGCNIAEGIDIPMKNLLVVDSKTEILSNQTSYTVLRHCALSELFKYAPNRTIPNYALKNFVTRFTYYQEEEQNQLLKAQQVQVPVHVPAPVPYVIENSDKLTKILEDASIHHLMDDNDNILLHVHCEFINNFHINEAERMRLVRKEATLAADHAIKTLREWIEKAGIFLSTAAHANANSGAICKLDAHDDFVVVPNENNKNKKKNKTTKAKVGHSPSDWAHRFIQVLLLPEAERTTGPATTSTTSATTTTWNQKQKKQVKTIRHNALDVDDDDLLAEYEETIMILTVSVFKGWKRVSNFVKKAIQNSARQSTKEDLLSSRNTNNTNTNTGPTTNPSPSPSLVRDNSDDEEIEEQGVEIIYDATEIEYDTCNQNVVFFSESMDEEEEEDEDEVVMITNPCEVDVISVSSSCESDELSFDELSFEDISEDVKEVVVVAQGSDDSDDSDDEWAMLSDDDDF